MCQLCTISYVFHIHTMREYCCKIMHCMYVQAINWDAVICIYFAPLPWKWGWGVLKYNCLQEPWQVVPLTLVHSLKIQTATNVRMCTFSNTLICKYTCIYRGGEQWFLVNRMEWPSPRLLSTDQCSSMVRGIFTCILPIYNTISPI